MSSRSSVTAQKMIAAGPALSKPPLLIKHYKDSELKLLNSDQLRAKLSKNVRKMNLLTEQNDEIVELLSSRGLKPTGDADCLMLAADSFKVIGSDGSVILQWPQKPEPLTADELKAGGWWMASATEQDNLELSKLVRVDKPSVWGDGDPDAIGCAKNTGGVFRINKFYDTDSARQIHRIGNNFYWGPPSD